MLHKCHTYPTFGSNFAFPAQTDRCGPILSTIRTPPSRKTRGPTHMPNPHAAIRMPPSACRRPHAAVRMPISARRRPHAAVRMPPPARRRPRGTRMPPPALPHVDSMQVLFAFHAGFVRVSCEIHARFIQVPACGFGFSDVLGRTTSRLLHVACPLSPVVNWIIND